MGLLPNAKQASLVLVAMLVSVIFPTLFRLVAGGAREPSNTE